MSTLQPQVIALFHRERVGDPGAYYYTIQTHAGQILDKGGPYPTYRQAKYAGEQMRDESDEYGSD